MDLTAITLYPISQFNFNHDRFFLQIGIDIDLGWYIIKLSKNNNFRRKI